jgi:hypothetical protein
MALPKLDYPTFEIPGIKVKGSPAKFRPFLVKEQKILMMAAESKDLSEAINNIKQVIQNCCVDPIDVDKISMSDLELIFVHIRAKSVGEVIELVYRCNNEPEENQRCNMIMNISVDLLKDVNYESKQESDMVWLNDKIAIKMRNPSIDTINLMDEENEQLSDIIISQCIDQIIEDEEVHDADSVNEKELIEFVSQIQTKDYQKMWNFIQNAPTIRYEKVHACPRCAYEHTIKLEGISDFFS